MEVFLDSPLDMHVHLREGVIMDMVTPLTAAHFSGAVIMPNLVPPVDNLDRLQQYRDTIIVATDGKVFEPLMMLFFRKYSESELSVAQKHIFGIKLYPAGATTNSEAGVRELSAVEDTLKLMEEMDIPLMVHGETHGFVMDREREFLASYDYLAQKFPRLKIIM